MVSGNPPRHSKSNDAPVTIDLDAEDKTRPAESEEAVESDAAEAAASSADKVETSAEAEQESESGYARARADEDAFSETIAREQRQDDVSAEPPETPTVSKPRDAAVSSLVASGIVGGLIALLCAGALQYAGLLPGGGSTAKDNASEITSLNSEIDGLKQTVANLAAAPAAKPDTALASRVAALEAALKNGTTAGGGDAGQGTAGLDSTNQKIADLSAEVDQLKAGMAQASQNQASTGADITKRLDAAEKKLSGPDEGAAVARAIAAAGLKAAIDRGGPFRPELDTFAGVAPDDPAIADLRNFAETGIPSRADLIRQVPDVANVIVNASQQQDPNQSWSNRLMSSAQSLVTVRPVGDVQGDGVDAIAARFENKVKNGDLPGAVSEWNTLPDTAKSASAAFKQSLDARIRVEDLVGEALSKAIAGAGKQG